MGAAWRLTSVARVRYNTHMDNDMSDEEVLRRYIELAGDHKEFRLLASSVAKSMREVTGLSLRKYAAQIGVSPSWWSKVERGKESLPSDVARRMLGIR